jgi:hypothetical protein
MPHQDFVRPNGLWPPEFVLTPGDLRRFDVAQFQALDGDAGGTWVPLTPITIGGQGLVLTGAGGLGHSISGGVLTLSGGRVYLGASMYPSFVAPVSRVINWLLLARLLSAQATNGTRFATKFTIGGFNSFILPVPSRQLHNGGKIASANVTYQIGHVHHVTPTVLPQVRFVRSDWLPWRPLPWTPFTNYPAGTVIQPSSAYPNFPFAYASTGAGGVSGATEPNWNTAAAINTSPAVDGTVTWVATGYSTYPPTWQTGHVYAFGTAVMPTHQNGLVYTVTGVAGTHTSGGVEPIWPLTPGDFVVDNTGPNQITWTCQGTARAAIWQGLTTYLVGAVVSGFIAGLYFKCTTGGATAGGEPAWNTAVGSTTNDGTVVWTCLGSNPIGAGSILSGVGGYPSPTAYYDGGVTQTMSVPCQGATKIDTVNYSYAYVLYDEGGLGAFEPIGALPWATGTLYTVTAPFVDLLVGPFVEPSPPNGYYYACTVSGTSGSPPPVWPTIIGATVTELHGSGGSGGTGPTWQCYGLAQQSQNLFMNVSFSFTSIADMRPE